MAEKRGGSRQALVDRMFHRCMMMDLRLRDTIVSVIGTELEDRKLDIDFMDASILNWSPTAYDLNIMISRVASREDDDKKRSYFPAYSDPRRFVSIPRVEALVKRAEGGEISAVETESLLAMYEDLQVIRDRFDQKARTVVRRQIQVTDLMVSIEATKMDLAEGECPAILPGQKTVDEHPNPDAFHPDSDVGPDDDRCPGCGRFHVPSVDGEEA